MQAKELKNITRPSKVLYWLFLARSSHSHSQDPPILVAPKYQKGSECTLGPTASACCYGELLCFFLLATTCEKKTARKKDLYLNYFSYQEIAYVNLVFFHFFRTLLLFFQAIIFVRKQCSLKKSYIEIKKSKRQWGKNIFRA